MARPAWFQPLSFADPSDSTTFRFVHVADTHLTAPRLTGDYNQNGVVDAADYVAWRGQG